jgi:hypothetical protein
MSFFEKISKMYCRPCVNPINVKFSGTVIRYALANIPKDQASNFKTDVTGEVLKMMQEKKNGKKRNRKKINLKN